MNAGQTAALALLALGAAGCDRLHAARTSAAVPENSPNAPAVAALEKSPPTATSAIAETIVTGKVKAAIAADPGMKGSDISVETDDGVVSLSGTVASQDQIGIATALAQRQQNVARVETAITVR